MPQRRRRSARGRRRGHGMVGLDPPAPAPWMFWSDVRHTPATRHVDARRRPRRPRWRPPRRVISTQSSAAPAGRSPASRPDAPRAAAPVAAHHASRSRGGSHDVPIDIDEAACSAHGRPRRHRAPGLPRRRHRRGHLRWTRRARPRGGPAAAIGSSTTASPRAFGARNACRCQIPGERPVDAAGNDPIGVRRRRNHRRQT